MRTRYLIAAGEYGAFMGECEGLTFWSGVYTAGFECAVTFASKAEAMSVVKAHRELFAGKKIDIREVHIIDKKYATQAECSAAGVRWTPPPASLAPAC